MPHLMRLFRSIALLCAAVAAVFASPVLPNGGFEEGLAGWVAKDTMSQVLAEAACGGKAGLRVTDADAQKGSDLMSARLPVVAGQSLALSFSSKSQGDFLAVYLWFADASGRPVKDDAKKHTGGMPAVGVKKGAGEWTPYSLKAVVPEGAATVSIWVHSWSSATGTADFDDFELTGVAADARPVIGVQPAVVAPAVAAAVMPELPARKAPPVIILKLDDLRQIDGKVHASWIKVADYLKSRNIKVGFGVITQTLEEATPAYTQWIKDRHAAGEIEFWFHGFDHAMWTNDAGKKLSEFGGRGFDEQWSRFERSQKLAQEKLGFTFAAFGPGGGGALHQDADTAAVMAKDPSMKVWLYPSPIDATGRKLAAEGKVTILDRVWAVNLEAAVGNPSFARFVEGYAKNPAREYFVLQGHPTHWAGARFDEFVKIIDFLVAQKAVFMTPSEYAASLGGKPAQQEASAK